MDVQLPLPSVETVLDKVKSDGTFDQFRKTCLAAVEAEVRYKSQIKNHSLTFSLPFMHHTHTHTHAHTSPL